MRYSQFNQFNLEINTIPTQQTEIDTYQPISCNSINNQPDSFPKSTKNCTHQGGKKDSRFQEKQGEVNTKRITKSTKHLGKIMKSHCNQNTPIIITPSANNYSRKTPEPSKDPISNKSSQTNLSFSNKQATIESSRYSAIHIALSKLKSMARPKKGPENNAGCTLRNLKNRQMVLHGLNVAMAEINKIEVQRYYTINCARDYTITQNPTDSD